MTGVAERAAMLAGGTLARAERLSGGSLSDVTRLHLHDGRALVAKHMQGADADAEAEMLRAIAATGAPVPRVVAVSGELLVMTEVAADGTLGDGAWTSLAAALHRLHAPTSEPFGWMRDHAFGTVAIGNARDEDWSRFWATHRLLCHVPHVGSALAGRLERLAARLHDHLPAEPPSVLLHGDLWGGNVLVSNDAISGLIDPACFYGHREVDTAMLTLFDHPPEAWFAALDLETGWRERLPAYRLWPLLVHLRLFGEPYRASVDDALRRLGA